MPDKIEDRELLVRLDTKMDGLKDSFTEVKKSLADVSQSVAAKADIGTVDKLETRMGKIEERQENDRQKLWMIVGGLVVAEFVLSRVLH